MKRRLFLILMPFICSASFPDGFSVIKPEGECDMAPASEFYVSSDNEYFTIDETSHQKILGLTFEGKTKIYHIKTGYNDAFPKLPDNSMTENTPLLTITDQEIVKMADEALASDNPVETVKRSVFGIVKKKTAGFPIMRARDILKLKEGDCTEHAVLTAAVLRAMKIPVCGSAGLVYAPVFAKQKDVFVFHMWCEAYYGGKWIIVDSALPSNDEPNQYIALANHSLKTYMPVPIDFIARFEKIKNLKIKAVR